MRVAVWLSVQR